MQVWSYQIHQKQPRTTVRIQASCTGPLICNSFGVARMMLSWSLESDLNGTPCEFLGSRDGEGKGLNDVEQQNLAHAFDPAHACTSQLSTYSGMVWVQMNYGHPMASTWSIFVNAMWSRRERLVLAALRGWSSGMTKHGIWLLMQSISRIRLKVICVKALLPL